MNILEETAAKINVNKEVLNTLPKNNKKNMGIYIKKLEELAAEFQGDKEKILAEIEKRYKKESAVHVNPEIDKLKKEVEDTEGILYLLNNIDTSYEKLGFDKATYHLRYYYTKNLERVSENILYCIKKFEEVGITLSLKDFCYSRYVRDYMAALFEEMQKETIDFANIKNKFEEIYWECPNIIMYIELNIRHLYFKNNKKIDKYYKNEQQKLLAKISAKEIVDRYKVLKKELIKMTNEDGAIIINSFLDGKLNARDYTASNINGRYLKFVSGDMLENADENKISEIDINIKEMANSVYEYKNYLKFKFIIEDIQKIYSQKDKYKNVYTGLKKQIAKEEKKIIKLDKKIKGRGVKLIGNQDAQIQKVKELYRELDKNKVYSAIAAKLNDESSLYDMLYLANSFYNYLSDCIVVHDDAISNDEREQFISELKDFVIWPYFTIINNIGMVGKKDILFTIKDRYRLLNLDLSAEDLEEDNLDLLIAALKNIETGSNIRKNKIDVDSLNYIYEFKKVLDIK